MTASAEVAYDRVSQALHWALAALILFLVFYHPSTEEGHGTPTDLEVTVHTSAGLVVLVLSLIRVGWRLCCARVPAPAPVAPWQDTLRRVAYAGFYGFMVAAPVIGVVLALGSELRVVPFGLAELPRLYADPASHGLLRSLHGFAADVLLYLGVLHVGAALYHQFRLRDGTLRRMVGPAR